MRVHILAPAEGQAGARYPKREVVQEFDNIALDQVIEEIEPPVHGWLIAWDGPRVFHFYGENGKWRFQSMASNAANEKEVENGTALSV